MGGFLPSRVRPGPDSADVLYERLVWAGQVPAERMGEILQGSIRGQDPNMPPLLAIMAQVERAEYGPPEEQQILDTHLPGFWQQYPGAFGEVIDSVGANADDVNAAKLRAMYDLANGLGIWRALVKQNLSPPHVLIDNATAALRGFAVKHYWREEDGGYTAAPQTKIGKMRVSMAVPDAFRLVGIAEFVRRTSRANRDTPENIAIGRAERVVSHLHRLNQTQGHALPYATQFVCARAIETLRLDKRQEKVLFSKMRVNRL